MAGKIVLMEQGWDPEVRQFFQKIISTLSYGVLWLVATATAGIYFKLGWREPGKPIIYMVLFYAGAVISFLFLLRYYYRLWKK